MWRQRWLVLVVLGAFALVAAACAPAAPPAAAPAKSAAEQPAPAKAASAAQKTVIRLGHLQAPTNHQQLAAQRFAELLSQKTSGAVEVQVFPSAQLGSGRDMFEAVRQGSLEMTMFAPDLLEPVVPVMGVMALPYIWDKQKAHKLLSGEFGKILSDKALAASGVRVIAWSDLGSQVMITKTKGVRVPDDLKGVKMRVPEAPATVQAFRVWGANPTVVTVAEVYNALQTGVVDGAVSPADIMFTQRYHEVAKNLSLTDHLFLPLNILISEKFFQSQPASVRGALTEAAREAFEVYDRQIYEKVLDDAITQMKSQGVTVIADPDREAFKRMVGPVWKTFTDKVSDGAPLITMMQEAK